MRGILESVGGVAPAVGGAAGKIKQFKLITSLLAMWSNYRIPIFYIVLALGIIGIILLFMKKKKISKTLITIAVIMGILAGVAEVASRTIKNMIGKAITGQVENLTGGTLKNVMGKFGKK